MLKITHGFFLFFYPQVLQFWFFFLLFLFFVFFQFYVKDFIKLRQTVKFHVEGKKSLIKLDNMVLMEWNLRKLFWNLKSAHLTLTQCKFLCKTKNSSFGQKMPYFLSFRTKFEGTTSIFEVSTFEFVKMQNSL